MSHMKCYSAVGYMDMYWDFAQPKAMKRHKTTLSSPDSIGRAPRLLVFCQWRFDCFGLQVRQCLKFEGEISRL